MENRRLVLALAVLALGALTILATGLNEMPFREAQQFARGEAGESEAAPEPLSQIPIEVDAWKVAAIVGLFALLVILVMLLLPPQLRTRLFWSLVKGLIWAVAIYFLLTNPVIIDILRSLGSAMGSQEGAPLPGETLTPRPAFEPPQATSTFSYAVSFAFALFLLAALWALYRSWNRYALQNAKKPLEDLARIARSSLDDLSAGANSGDVIINCYLRMSAVVSSRRQLQRESAMTPREFAARLEEAGLPGEAVAQLTRLFEGVRYGDRKSAPREVNEAVSCLKTILQHCGEPI